MGKLKSIAEETLRIAEEGRYRAPSGVEVILRDEIDRAVGGTELFPPQALAELVAHVPQGVPDGRPAIQVTGETTSAAGRRLFEEGLNRIAALNFASAKNPGGGFIRGAKAQEEDLARCSALYPCLMRQPGYYEANRSFDSLLYTDHIIYSPDVPFFRGDSLALLERPYLLSIITAPAPNAGEYLRREGEGRARVHEALERRAAMVLAVAQARGHRILVLGAWGCGVFRNEPREVAAVFRRWLEHPRFSGAFERVVFAVYDRSEGRKCLRAFETELGTG